MTITPAILTYLLVIVACLMGLLCGVTILANLLLIRKAQEIKRENEKLHRDLHDKLDAIITDAAAKTKQTLADIEQKALAIVSQTQYFSEATKKEFLKTIEETKTTETATFAKTLDSAEQDLLKTFTDISKTVEDNLSSDYSNLQKQLATIPDTVRRQMEDEAKGYKEQLLERVEEYVYRTFERVTRQLVGKSLSLTDKSDLLEEALEEARSSHVI
ncbi:hypothetical protein C4579_01170 [Candidatus Microgenomates bacterium]|nr:MAG: hypothetical protein C4579_01170 [Candidatus Microgenomates bacterium]